MEDVYIEVFDTQGHYVDDFGFTPEADTSIKEQIQDFIDEHYSGMAWRRIDEFGDPYTNPER